MSILSYFESLANPSILPLKAFPTELPDLPVEEIKKRLGLATVYKLSFNENPYGPSPRVVEAMREAASRVHLYPDSYGTELMQAIAADFKVEVNQVLLSNGADEMINLVAQTFLKPGDQVVIPSPTFGAYAAATRMVGAGPAVVELTDLTVDLDKVMGAVTGKTRIIFICNPNNPTGTMVSPAVLEGFIRRLPGEILVVLDEAYNEYTGEPDKASCVGLISRYPNVAVIRTFSKSYALAAVRVGYLLASPEVVALVHKVRPPFNVNAIGQAGALAALKDRDYLARVRENNRLERDFLTGQLESLGVRTVPSSTNFVMADIGRDSLPVYEGLARRGVIVRPGFQFGLSSHLRISIGSRLENLALVAALADILGAQVKNK